METLLSIFSNGLQKGTYITPDEQTAEDFALHRSSWNTYKPVIITLFKPKYSKIKLDKRGRKEAFLNETYHLSSRCLLKY